MYNLRTIYLQVAKKLLHLKTTSNVVVCLLATKDPYIMNLSYNKVDD